MLADQSKRTVGGNNIEQEVKDIKTNYLNHDVISRDTIMEILDRFERRAIEDVRTDNIVDVDNFESVGKYKLIMKIKQAIGMALRKDWPRKRYSLDDILLPGKLWD